MNRKTGIGVLVAGMLAAALCLAAVVPIPTPGASGTVLTSNGPGAAVTWSVLPEAGIPGGWQTGMACNFSTQSATISANGLTTICGYPWMMQEYANVSSNWVVSSSGLAANCNSSNTYGRTDPTLSVRYQDVVPNWVETTPIRVTMCWSAWTPGSSNGGLHEYSQNVWDAGTCQWGSQMGLDYNHVSGNNAIYVDTTSARGCAAYPYNSSIGLVYTTAAGTGANCIRSTWPGGIQGPSLKEISAGATTPPTSGWNGYGYLGAADYLYVSTTAGLGGAWTATTFSSPTWYSTGLGMYCTGTNSAVFSYFGVEYKF
jgi:hypothetical protein